MATIADLPKELMFNIFSHYVRSEGHVTFLRNIPRVCRTWNDISSDSSLWRNVRARDSNYLLNVSRRGLLYNTQILEFADDESFYQMNLWPVLKNIRDLKALDLKGNYVRRNAITVVTKFCPHLESFRSVISKPSNTMRHDLDDFLTVCGPTLKHLDLKLFYSREAGQRLASGIAAKCPLLETLSIASDDAPVPIDELRRGCPRLKELRLAHCRLITTGGKDFLGCGFKDLNKFRATWCNFSDVDIYCLLKDSMELQQLELLHNMNLVFDNVSKIPSDKVSVLGLKLRDPVENWNSLQDAVWKWRRTLSVLEVGDWECDMNSVIERLLQDNPDPQLRSLIIRDYDINPRLFQKLALKCQNLIHLEFNFEEYRSREEINEALEYLVGE